MPAVELAVAEAGSGDPVLLLHGLGSRGDDWELQREALSRSYRVVIPDLRGHGESIAPSGEWTMRDVADDVAELLRRRATGPVHVIGLSLGGMVAFQLLADHPALVRSAVIINRQITGAHLEVIRDSGHATPMDQPDALHAVVLPFLTSVASTRSLA